MRCAMIRILLADDHALFRGVFRDLLDQQPDMTVVAEASGGASAVALSLETRPDIVVMDLIMPSVNGIEATMQLVRQWPTCKVLGVSALADARLVDAMTTAGALGFVTKDSAPADIVAAVRTICAEA